MQTTSTGEPDGAASCDRSRLRAERLARCFAAMERHGLDALVLGREGNVRYVTDARRLWLAGARPFGPGCVVVRATREVHLLSTSSDGVPETIPASRLYPLTWNPDHLAARLGRIEGLADARTVGVDGWNPAAARLLARVAPSATLADGDAALREARAVKLPDEIACLRAAAAVARAGLAAAREVLDGAAAPSEPALRAAFVARAATLGATIPAFGSIVHPAVPGPRLVALRCGVLLDGYEATLARTYATGAATARGAVASELARRGARLRERLRSTCRPGAQPGDLLAAYTDAGEPLPPFPIAHGVGLGCEPPLIGRAHTCDPGWRMVPGMVVALHAFVAADDGTGYLTQDMLHVRAAGCELLTAEPDGLASLSPAAG